MTFPVPRAIWVARFPGELDSSCAMQDEFLGNRIVYLTNTWPGYAGFPLPDRLLAQPEVPSMIGMGRRTRKIATCAISK